LARTVRPADPRETVAAWRSALLRTGGPTALALTRQSVPTLDVEAVEQKARRGGYVVVECDGAPELVIVATGSELGLAVDAARALQKDGRKVRAVSLPCLEVFFEQDDAYQRAVLGEARRLVVEAGVALGLATLVRPGDRFHGMRGFGASASYQKLAERFRFTSADVTEIARELL
jgi:transketolase